MFGLFKKHGDTEGDFVYDQALIVRIPQAKELGDEGSLKKVAAFEEEVEKVLPAHAGVDGHEFGDYEALIYIYGPSAKALHLACKDLLADYFSGQGAEITLQYGTPDDPKTRLEKIAL